MNAEALQEARDRNGAKDPSRDDEIDEILAPKEKVGFQVEEPLLNCSYSSYPRHDELLRPDAHDALQALAEHDLVTDVEDISSELGTDEDTVEKALNLHSIEAPEGFEIEVNQDRLTAILGDIPDDMRSANNPIVVSALYLKGLSLSEIADVLQESTDARTVRERDTRQVLIDCGILDGESSSEMEKRLKQGRGRGLTVSTESFK